MFHAGITWLRVPRTNSEWGGAEEVSQMRSTGFQSWTVLDASVSRWTHPAGERKTLADFNQNSDTARFCLQRLDWPPVWRRSWEADEKG